MLFLANNNVVPNQPRTKKKVKKNKILQGKIIYKSGSGCEASCLRMFQILECATTHGTTKPVIIFDSSGQGRTSQGGQ